jgi:predicted acylesterase/phospholipase RssA
MTRLESVGLALAGGVVEGGFYEVGVLCALADAVEGLDLNALGVYTGVSVGAAIAALLANGVAPRTLSEAILERAPDPTLNLDPDSLFTPAWGEYLGRLLRLPGVLGRTAARVLTGRAELSAWGALSALGPVLPTALFDGRGLERYLARAFSGGGRTNDFRALQARLRVVAVRLDTAELVAFGGPQTEHVPISRAVQASAALPGLFCPVEVDGALYIDGVARRTLNASLGLKQGARLMLCVNPIVPVSLRAGAGRTLADHGLPGVLSQTFRTVIHSRMSTGMKGYEHDFPDADLVLIEPAMEDDSLFFSNIFSFANRRGVGEDAYAGTRRWLLRDFDRLAPVFARHGLTLRRDVLEDASRRLYPDSDVPRGAADDAERTLARLDEGLTRIVAA